MFQNALQSFLSLNINKADVVSPNRIPRDTSNKYLVYQKVTANSPMGHDGPFYIYEDVYQLDSYASKKEDAQNIIEQAKDKLFGYMGNMNNYKISGIEIDNHTDSYENDSGLYRERMDVRIRYQKRSELNE